MFTDMADYTALGQRNEPLSLALVEEQRKLIRPILGRNNGREVKTMGDAFLVEFPNALDAVRCAYDIQRAAREFNISQPEERRIHLRVGLHLGDVVESQGDISGDAVNVASRIESFAEVGGVCLTRQVYDHVQNKFELPLTGLGVKLLKNVSTPLEVYKMVMPWKEEEPRPPGFATSRIAVLPFSNLSPDPNDEYFADGMTEEVISTMSRIEQFEVISRTSVMQYKKNPKSIREVARELNVGTVLEGSVRKSGNKLRVTVQMIDAERDRHLWVENYDRQLDDVFVIQSDVAKQVAEALKVRLLTADKKKLERVPTSNIAAYTLYLKGSSYFNKTTVGDYGTAIDRYEQAIDSDPDFASAHAELAFCYAQLGWFGMLPSREAEVKAKKYVEKALRLDDSLAKAHHVKGQILRSYDWDFGGAATEYRRAIELNPSCADAYGANALLMTFDRRFDEAISEAGRALELDPISGIASQYAGTVFLYAGRPDDALEQFTNSLKANPDNAYARGNVGLAHVQKGIFEVGIREMEEVETVRSPSTQIDIAYSYAKAGMIEELKKHLNELLSEASRNTEWTVAVASAYANLGDPDRALEWLEKAYSEHIAYLPSVNADFAFDGIRSDPRFQALMRKVGWKNT